MMRRHASWVVANGFSQKTGLPASIEASTRCELAPESRYLLPQEQAEQPQAWEEQGASAEQAAPV